MKTNVWRVSIYGVGLAHVHHLLSNRHCWTIVIQESNPVYPAITVSLSLSLSLALWVSSCTCMHACVYCTIHGPMHLVASSTSATFAYNTNAMTFQLKSMASGPLTHYSRYYSSYNTCDVRWLPTGERVSVLQISSRKCVVVCSMLMECCGLRKQLYL